MTTLITGADGYLGRRIAAALRAAGDDLILAVRAADSAELKRKQESLNGHSRVVPLDLRHPNPFEGIDPGRITRVIHAAAVIRFDVERGTAQRVNVDGTARVRQFAERCPRLHRLIHLSTLYTAGRHTGDIKESRHRHGETGAGFVNHYEWSKWAAEEHVLDAERAIVIRLPTVIGEDEHGTVGQFNAFHHTLRLYFHGLLTLLPGEPATPLSLASAAFTVAAVMALLDAEPGIYQACPGPIPLGTTIDVAFDTFERDQGFRRRMLPRPLPCDRESFLDMATAATTLRGGPLHKALGSVAPFAEQLYLPKRFATDRLRGAWPACPAPDPAALVESVCSSLIARSFHASAH